MVYKVLNEEGILGLRTHISKDTGERIIENVGSTRNFLSLKYRWETWYSVKKGWSLKKMAYYQKNLIRRYRKINML